MSDTKTTTKPGYETTEFWLALAAKLLGAAFATGLIADGSPAARIAGVAAAVLASLGYSVSRGLAKAAAMMLVIGLAASTQLTACGSQLATDVKALPAGAVACLKADEPAAIAAGKALLADAFAGALAGKAPADIWARFASDLEAAAIAQGVPVAACAGDSVLTDIGRILHPPAPAGSSSSALSARFATADPAAGGRAVLAAWEASHGVTSVVR